MAEEVEVNEYGQPISKNCTTLGSRKGALIRTHVPISYTSWKIVPTNYKDDVWNNLKEEYKIPEAAKATIVKSMVGPWRKFKCELRTKYYDKYATDEERIEHVPPKIKREDWITFCENENKEEAKKSRIEHKRKRENLSYSHCSGRKPHSLVRAELEAANPEVEVSTEDVWLTVHTQAGGAILPSAKPFADMLKKTQEEIKEKQDAGLPVEDPCAMSATFGKDSRGRVRSVGPISRMQVELSAPARAKVNELKAKDGSLSQRMEELGGQMGFLIENFGTLCDTVKDIQTGRQASVIGSNTDIISRDVQSCSQSLGGTPSGSHTQTNSPVGPIVSPAQSAVRDMARCSLLNMDGEIIATGRLCTGDLGRMCHSQVVPPNLAKVVLDKILLPLQVTAKANMLVATFREVGVGGFVLHPKMCITYD